MRRLLLFVGLGLAALPAGSALADVTIGQVGGVSSPITGSCPGTAVLADTNYAVPSGGGFVNSFSFQVGRVGEQVDFLVLRPGGDTYSVVGRSGLVTLPNAPVATFPVTPSIPVQGGDILGMWFPDPPGLTSCARPTGPGSGGIISTDFGVADPAVGQTVSFNGPDVDDDLNLSANLVTPTRDSCRKGGWLAFDLVRHQGDCMSFVSSGGKNPPNPR